MKKREGFVEDMSRWRRNWIPGAEKEVADSGLPVVSHSQE